MVKYILVCGGVISGIGKGVIASSTGLILKAAGLKVTAIKIDPYMNIDAGTMAPTEHGEVYVLNDGGETDLDLGNYERYLDVSLNKDNNITTGKVYQHVIDRERKGDYLGKTVQIIPHLTNAIQDWIERVSKIPVDGSGEEPDVCVVELGGTVGDIESMPFVEALRQFQFRVGHENFALIYVSLIPVVGGEQKTKPTQAGVRDLRGLGLLPDLIACRCTDTLLTATMEKVSMFCHVSPQQVLGVHNVNSTYHVPLLLQEQGMLNYFKKRLNLGDITIKPQFKQKGEEFMGRWKALTTGQERLFDSVSIVLVGKYTSLQDSYMSVVKALEHASMRCGRKLELQWVDSSDLEPETQVTNPVRFHDAWSAVCSAKGIIVPGGFGHRGTEGMIAAVKWAREQKVPFLGICLGFQVAVIEWARNVCGLKAANSAELVPDVEHPVICFMPEISKTHMGGTMRLGLRPTIFQSNTENSKLRRLYGGHEVAWERHRHRYEVEPRYVEQLESKGGLRFVGKDERGERMQMAELDDHPYFVALQAHPEFCSRPLNPSPPFLGLIAAACGSSVLAEQIASNEKSYVDPHPKEAKVVPASDAATDAGKGRKQAVDGVKVEGEVNGDLDETEKQLAGVTINSEVNGQL
ncbi:CTP synthase [Kwoniella heveanensis CBS 569]|uniref:CTP synthase n=1 Tax=Kwoniella heveanensis BCC8398 TaxID=1296120 RepID=A0A1B9GLF6_9TREE|nr:CTP synthase [Kwoniella heveanensis BCC8398]OCF42863.1 CTP synthase [Kwoniella heveanensis CBS 569]